MDPSRRFDCIAFLNAPWRFRRIQGEMGYEIVRIVLFVPGRLESVLTEQQQREGPLEGSTEGRICGRIYVAPFVRARKGCAEMRGERGAVSSKVPVLSGRLLNVACVFFPVSLPAASLR